ncbi:MAG: DUF5121 domain-containing protein, partial [Prevotellaceae bacterium]|nr:DUF5121 domain-containing protein [Prevotellaceae bacterium]
LPGSTYTFIIDASGGHRNIQITILENDAPPDAPASIPMTFGGYVMNKVDNNGNYKVEQNFTQNQDIVIGGGLNNSYLDDWWIDPDFLEKTGPLTLRLLSITAKYRVTANIRLKYFRVEVMSGSNLASLNTNNGSGAIWVIGEGIGKPSLEKKHTDWNTGNALCMAPTNTTSPRIYTITFKAGESLNIDNINFKFFHQADWGGEFTHERLTTTSDLVFLGDGNNGRDPGNLYLIEGKIFEAGATYRFTIQVTTPVNTRQSILTVTKL